MVNGEPIYMPGSHHDCRGAIGTGLDDLKSRFYVLDADSPTEGLIATSRRSGAAASAMIRSPVAAPFRIEQVGNTKVDLSHLYGGGT